MCLLNEIFNSDDQSFMLEIEKEKKGVNNRKRTVHHVYVFRFRKLNGYLKTSMTRITT